MDNGWIKLYRQIRQGELYREPRKFSKFEAWLDILLRAYPKEKDGVKVGTFPTSYGKLAKAWHWNKKSVWNFLKYLMRENMITVEGNEKVTDKETVISVVNWGTYQSKGNGKGNEKVTNSEFLPITEKEERNIYSRIHSFWNQQKIIVHQELTEEMIKAIDKATQKLTVEQITTAIQRYAQILNDESYFFKYRWTLVDFLSRKAGVRDFLDDGAKWVSYQGEQKAKPATIKKDNDQPTLFTRPDFL